MRTVRPFRAPTAYEEEMLKAQRQQQLAEMLRQQAEAPEQEYSYQGIRAMPSIAGGLAKVLKSYNARKAEERADEAARAAREADIAGAEELRRELAPQARVAAPTTAEIAGGVGMPQISEAGTVSYGPSVQAPTRTEMVGPTAAERKNIFANYAVSGTPTAQRLAQVLAGQEPESKTVEFGNQLLNVTDGQAAPVMMGGKAVTASPKPEAGSSLAKLVRERNDFLPGDPNIAIWDQAIKSEIGSKAPVVQMPSMRDKAKDEGNLRDQLQGRLKDMDWAGMQQAYQRVYTAGDNPTGDVSIIYALAKGNDSSGAVRKEDFDALAKSGSLGARIQGLYNEAANGRLTAPKRQELVDEVYNLYQTRFNEVQGLVNTYGEIAKNSELNSSNVTKPFEIKPLGRKIVWSAEKQAELDNLRKKKAGG